MKDVNEFRKKSTIVGLRARVSGLEDLSLYSSLQNTKALEGSVQLMDVSSLYTYFLSEEGLSCYWRSTTFRISPGYTPGRTNGPTRDNMEASFLYFL